MDRLFDEDEYGAPQPDPESDDDLGPSFDTYVAQGIELLEEWMREPY